ncbi:GDSL-type esterase/lipase family protein [Serratia marcescens]|uniref:SGNH/GDSL hydrolase family protein n=1 Tax=Serratia marcescens TaxID=615 RepID=UPI001924E1AD
MFYLDNNSGVPVMPKPQENYSDEPLWFTEDKAKPSYPGADWFNAVTMELLNILKLAGISPDKFKFNQLSTAISQLLSAMSVVVESEEEGLSKTSTGQYFAVPQGLESKSSFRYFRNNDGVAVPVASTLGEASVNYFESYVDIRLKRVLMYANKIAICSFRDGSVPLRLINGLLDATGVTPELALKSLVASGKFSLAVMPGNKIAVVSDSAGNVPLRIIDGLVDATGVTPTLAINVLTQSGAVTFAQMNSNKVAFIRDRAGNVIFGFHDGLLHGSGLSPALMSFIAEHLGSDAGGSVIKNHTDGHTLNAARAKVARLQEGHNVTYNKAWAGDSYAQMTFIPGMMAENDIAKYGRAGAGWIALQFDGLSSWEGITLTYNKSAWTEYDASSASGPPTYGCGIDGHALYTRSNSEPINFANINATRITVYYFDSAGKFTLAVDGGNPVSIVCGNTRGIKSYTFSGLESKNHTVTLTPTGNSDVVCLTGLYTASTNKGVIINKIGNGGAKASDYENKIAPWIPYYTADMAIDILYVVLGTNDHAGVLGLAKFESGLKKIIDTYRNALPTVGIVLVSPPQTNAYKDPPLSAYNDTLKRVALERGVEYYAGYDNFAKTFDVSNAQGVMYDGWHVNRAGARVIVNDLEKYTGV